MQTGPEKIALSSPKREIAQYRRNMDSRGVCFQGLEGILHPDHKIYLETRCIKAANLKGESAILNIQRVLKYWMKAAQDVYISEMTTKPLTPLAISPRYRSHCNIAVPAGEVEQRNKTTHRPEI
jgi:hypothetical protein